MLLFRPLSNSNIQDLQLILTKDVVIRPKKLSEWTGFNRIHSARLQVDKNRARDIFTSCWNKARGWNQFMLLAFYIYSVIIGTIMNKKSDFIYFCCQTEMKRSIICIYKYVLPVASL